MPCDLLRCACELASLYDSTLSAISSFSRAACCLSFELRKACHMNIKRRTEKTTPRTKPTTAQELKVILILLRDWLMVVYMPDSVSADAVITCAEAPSERAAWSAGRPPSLGPRIETPR